MQALLLVAHGSRREASNDEVRQLTQLLAKKSENKFQIIECAFLELAQPSIPSGVSMCVAQGAAVITVLPYFLSAGRHVSTDIPAELEKSQELHPNVCIKMAPYLGAAAEISDILVSQSSKAV